MHIAHIDVDAFFASALQRKRPELRGKPLLALGMGGARPNGYSSGRGCVIAASYEAKAFGVKTGMRLTDARKLCPQAIALPSDFREALLASTQIEKILANICPFIEKMSIDEWFVDLSSIPGGAPSDLLQWAQETQKRIARSTALTVSIGIGPSKLLAKMASEYKKPAGVFVVQKNTIRSFLKDRPAAAIPGIGKRRNTHAEKQHWHTAWDIAAAEPGTIVHLFGKPGRDMQRELNGEMLSNVEKDTRPPKSVSRCRSFRRTNSKGVVFAHVLHHMTYVTIKLRRHERAASGIIVWVRDGEYKHTNHYIHLPQPADTEEELFPFVRECFEKVYTQKPCTQVGLALTGLEPRGAQQYSLFEESTKIEGNESIQQALDNLHKRYGRSAVTRASAMAVSTMEKAELYAI